MVEYRSEEISRLVELAAKGDLAAYGRLVTLTENVVRAVARRELRDHHTAEDAVQETFLRAHARLSTLRDPAAFVGWLRRVAATTAQNQRRRRRFVFLEPAALEARVSAVDRTPAVASATRAALARAMVGLSTDDRRLCERFYRAEWSTDRLAADLGISGVAVRKRLQRVREKLRREMMTNSESESTQDGLPERIVALLARPILIDLPENPVGAVWELVRAACPDHEEVDLPERIRIADLEDLFGPEEQAEVLSRAHRVNESEILRFDQTIPMLLAARGRPVGSRLLAAGKVYRDAPEDSRHLMAFHQAEILWIDEELSPWSVMEWMESTVESILPGLPIRVEQVEYPLYADRGWEVLVKTEDGWLEIAGWARFGDRVVTKLGHDPRKITAVGLGLGLERLACLRYGIDDVRHVAKRRVDE